MISQPRALRAARALYRTFGVRGLRRRAVHELRRRSGRFREQPAARSYSAGVPLAAPYAPSGDARALSAEQVDRALARAHRVLAGTYEAFGHEWRLLPQGPEGWSTDARTHYRFASAPWWTLNHLPSTADVKDVWEPARFGWVYDLIRGYKLSSDRVFATAFHERLAEWMRSNPPFAGVHWSCGQETAIRALAILHAEASLPASNDRVGEAADRLAMILSWSGERIADAIGYALSQRNNHGISEAAALVHLGVRLRGSHLDAESWLRTGLSFLDEQIADQFADDGWYAQHSFSYMRLAMEQALLAQRVLATVGLSLSTTSLRRLARAHALLLSVIDGESGIVPNHGASDGSRVAPLSTAPYRDFRPLLTLAAIILDQPLPIDVPPDREVVYWLGGAAPRTSPPREDGVVTGSSGWAVARVGRASVFLRAGRYRHRPSHLDSLHVDVRFGSREVVTDAGTFAYNGQAPWKNALASAFVHNGPVLDEREPAERGPRFLWYSWPQATIRTADFRDGRARIVAEVPARVRREVLISERRVIVSDRVLDPLVRRVRVCWLVHPDLVGNDCVHVPDAKVVTPAEGAVAAWFSPTYGCRLPGLSLVLAKDVRGTDVELTAEIVEPAMREP